MADSDSSRVVISRKEAKRLGLRHYFTGVPCIHGHLVHRYTSTFQCADCVYLWGDQLAAREPIKERNRIRVKKKRWYWRHRNTRLKKSKEYRAKNRKLISERVRKRRLSNRDKINARKRQIYSENKKELNEIQRQQYAKNPEKRKSHNNNWKSRRLGNGGTYTADDIDRIFKHQCGKCAYFLVCGARISSATFHIDHIVPLSRGGRNDARNLQLLCASCNLRKHARDPIDHAQSLGFLL